MTLNNKKILTTMFAALVVCMLAMPPLVIPPNIHAQTMTASEQLKAQIEPQPTEAGCYKWTKATGWQTAHCLSQDQLDKHPLDIPTEGGKPDGVKGGTTSSTKPTWSEVDITFPQFGGESDSAKGTNAWSIQDNTNTWLRSSDNHKMWVQFTEQYDPNGYKDVCIWQFDLTAYPSNPHKKCTDNDSTSTLSTSFEGFVTGYVQSGTMLRSTYCNVGAGHCWTVVDNNFYDSLGPNWTQVSGTILGYGSTSTAVFAHPTQVTATVQASAETSATTTLSTDTGETNNLSYNSASTSCAGGTCTTTTSSSY